MRLRVTINTKPETFQELEAIEVVPGVLAVHPCVDQMTPVVGGTLRPASDEELRARAYDPEKRRFVITLIPCGWTLGGWRFKSEQDAIVTADALSSLEWGRISPRSSPKEMHEFGRLVHQIITGLYVEKLIERPRPFWDREGHEGPTVIGKGGK